ncbi:beta-1,3-galactosyltransferase 5-like [Heteronotia binoei]|uniref:beta-1,3-galactosyltransferase 5-like n=1 Tax=Heteronotia binoei TaxID=13085 RepID=UPI002930A852|nr:beta-1,3-galactosyltransferase 5-like [Heteronotia binoei]
MCVQQYSVGTHTQLFGWQTNNPMRSLMIFRRHGFFFVMVLAVACFIMFNSIGICPACTRDMSAIVDRNIGDFVALPDKDCSKNPPFLVILVTSQLSQTTARMAIRETWGKERIIAGKRIVTYFLLGNNSHVYDQFAVTTESSLYKDIIRKDFLDTYYNLTLKTLMGLEWIHKFCSLSSFVMKTDSDMFVNTYYLTELLLKRNKTNRFFTGVLRIHDHPVRYPGSKWYVNKREYPGRKYPPFCSGTGYVLSTDLASEVYLISNKVPYFKLEDVFVGLCLAELKIKPKMLHSEPTFFTKQVKFSPCRYRKLVTSHYVTASKMLEYWNGLEKSMIHKCPGH